MGALKKDNGFTLIEIILVLGLVGILLVLLSVNYLGVHKTYIKETKKAHNLEQARLVVNYLTDNFQKYEAGYCEIIISKRDTKLENNETDTVKEIIFQDQDGSNKQTMVYKATNKKVTNKKVTFQSQEVASHINGFTVTRSDDLYHFIIEVKQEGKGVIPDQMIRVGTTMNLKYMKDRP